jgi:hypothetical protein
VQPSKEGMMKMNGMMSGQGGQIITTSANGQPIMVQAPNQSPGGQAQMPMIVLSSHQMGNQMTSPTRLVMAQPDWGQSQNGQGKYIVVQQPQPQRVVGKWEFQR